jgi:hypothetical protein
MGGKYSCDSSNKEINSCKYDYFAGFWGLGITIFGIIIGILLIYAHMKYFLGKPFMILLYCVVFIISGIFMMSSSFDAVRITNNVKDCPTCPTCNTLPSGIAQVPTQK